MTVFHTEVFYQFWIIMRLVKNVIYFFAVKLLTLHLYLQAVPKRRQPRNSKNVNLKIVRYAQMMEKLKWPWENGPRAPVTADLVLQYKL